MTVDLEEVAVALDAFPHWDENMRAEVFDAIDAAPETYVQPHENTDYFGGRAEWEWNRIKRYRLGTRETKYWPVTLEEASGYESAPTKGEILKALYRGARMI